MKNHYFKRIFLLTIYLVVIGAGCQQGKIADKRKVTPRGMTKEEVTAIAKAAVAKIYPDRELEVDNLHLKDHQWVMAVWILPISPGSFYFVRVSETGQILKLIHGY